MATVSDSMVRPDQNLVALGDWTDQLHTQVITGNKAFNGGSGYGSSYWSRNTFGPSHSAKLTVRSNVSHVGPGCRMSVVGGSYKWVVAFSSGSLQRANSGSPTTIGSYTAANIGDQMELIVSPLTMYYVFINGILVLTVDDPTGPTDGYAGIGWYDAAASAEGWSATGALRSSINNRGVRPRPFAPGRAR